MKIPQKIPNILGDNIGFISLVDAPQIDPCLKVANSARISYAKSTGEFTEKDKKLTTFLWEEEHTSPFRHSYFTLHLKIPLFVARQWMKYQVGGAWRTFEINDDPVSLETFDHFYSPDSGCSWNEVSGRYVVLTPEFYVPKLMRGNPPHGNKQSSVNLDLTEEENEILYLKIKDAMEESFKIYQDLLSEGVAKELARMVLPQSMYTEVYWTVSLQGVMHFIQQRTSEHAQYEIREYALALERLFSPVFDALGISRRTHE